MAQIIENPKGFKVLRISRSELIEHLGKYGAVGICDSCSATPQQGYYISVLNQWYCENCYKRFILNRRRYKEDEPYEEQNFLRMCSLFDPSK